ncbi:hypothetical protein SRHO_G00258700 [Serrasalmus rhombeus]
MRVCSALKRNPEGSDKVRSIKGSVRSEVTRSGCYLTGAARQLIRTALTGWTEAAQMIRIAFNPVQCVSGHCGGVSLVFGTDLHRPAILRGQAEGGPSSSAFSPGVSHRPV